MSLGWSDGAVNSNASASTASTVSAPGGTWAWASGIAHAPAQLSRRLSRSRIVSFPVPFAHRVSHVPAPGGYGMVSRIRAPGFPTVSCEQRRRGGGKGKQGVCRCGCG